MDHEQSTPTSDLELLTTEIAVIRSTDDWHPLRGTDDIVVVLASSGEHAVLVGDRVPRPLTDRVATVVAATGAGTGTGVGGWPAVVDACTTVLGQVEQTGRQVSGGPSYLVDLPVHQVAAPPVVCSDDPDRAALLDLRPATWEQDEWAELIAGGAGAPWAMLRRGDQVVSVCHTSRLTRAGAEAGTWTASDHRGRGYAAATTAAWARLVTDVRPHLFYSTRWDNRSSQRVAERLGLRQLGSLWTFTRTGGDAQAGAATASTSTS